ncbi:MAG: hypothetical protein A2275_03405 [Bacteroidetes bacterium RIFOXYA12_FULL_35_11]|nr:MAG: hypothetical protein A2X01_17155 [Bacteroidetes bacterium GWF2_35_48]OFY82032.1 MAG: hypothetical protein A2275_03405 [Bacteroidetes bacterium RIFOXYA12_FULL_35_11]HBX51830.1 hypothetical protein [Bacteroidales bacterium]
MGNSNVIHNYDLTLSRRPELVEGEPGLSGYYRLKQTDFDGEFTYSDIVHTNCHVSEIEIINIFPNPAHDYFSFAICSIENREIYIKVEDVLGRILIRENEIIAKGLNNLKVDVSKLAPATYYFSIESSDGVRCESKQILIK